MSKDTIGGYGTANRFGDGIVSKAITWVMAREVDWPPLYAAQVAGVLEAQGHEVDYSKHFDSSRHYDLCLITSSIVAHETELAALKQVTVKGIPVGVMGPFATTNPSPYLEEGGFVISGEPEMYFLNSPLPEPGNLSFSGILASGDSVPLDELPYPAWKTILQSNQPKFGLLGGEAMLPIAATRGCPYSCFNYCVYPLQQGRKVRLRDPKKIVQEMEYWAEKIGISFFIFRDPVFSINRKHTLEICEELEKSPYKFKFIIETHLNNLDDELAQRLKGVGLDMVKVGIEATSQQTLEQSKRFGVENDKQIKIIRALEELGIKITCFYILGMPGDTHESFKETMKYARRLNTVFAQISVFTPYPGTPAFDDFKDKIIVDKYEDFTQYDLVYRHQLLNPREIRKLLSRSYRDYYLRPRWMIKYLAARFS